MNYLIIILRINLPLRAKKFYFFFNWLIFGIIGKKFVFALINFKFLENKKWEISGKKVKNFFLWFTYTFDSRRPVPWISPAWWHRSEPHDHHRSLVLWYQHQKTFPVKKNIFILAKNEKIKFSYLLQSSLFLIFKNYLKNFLLRLWNLPLKI